jgi:hypothetical protein
MAKQQTAIAIPEEVVMSKIYEIRGQKVMLDSDLAELYQVETKRLKEAVKRNITRFPVKYMFELTEKEHESLRSQIATSKTGRGGTRYLPMVFTEHGVLQLSNVLRSDRAEKVSFIIIDVFVRLREMILTHKDILMELEAIKQKVGSNSNDIELIFNYLKQFEAAKQQELEQQQREKIGYKTKK